MSAFLVMMFAVSLMISFLMSGMETGLFALSQLRIRHQMRAGNPRAKVLYGYLENTEDFLWTILVGNTVASFVAVSIGVAGLYLWVGRWPVALLVSLMIAGMLFYSFCELLPKMLFRLFPNRLCLWTALPFRLVHAVLRPLVLPMAWLANRLAAWFGGGQFTGRLFGNRKELRSVVQESAMNMSREEYAMIKRVLNLQTLTLRQIAVPMAKVASADTQTPVNELLQICRQRGFSRLPIWNRTARPGRVVGLVNVNKLLFQANLDAEQVAGELVKPALFLNADLALELALRQMQRTGQRLAIVVETDQSELGVASFQDILKVIFGEVAF